MNDEALLQIIADTLRIYLDLRDALEEIPGHKMPESGSILLAASEIEQSLRLDRRRTEDLLALINGEGQ